MSKTLLIPQFVIQRCKGMFLFDKYATVVLYQQTNEMDFPKITKENTRIIFYNTKKLIVQRISPDSLLFDVHKMFPHCRTIVTSSDITPKMDSKFILRRDWLNEFNNAVQNEHDTIKHLKQGDY